MKNWIAICPARGAEVSGRGATVEGGGKRIKHTALLLLVEEEASIKWVSDSVERWETEGKSMEREGNDVEPLGYGKGMSDTDGCRVIHCKHTHMPRPTPLFALATEHIQWATHISRLQLQGEVAFYRPQVTPGYYRGKKLRSLCLRTCVHL